MKTPRITWCANCDKRPAFYLGLCHACAQYQQRTGRPRPKRLWDLQRVINFCECGNIIRAGKVCETCRSYIKRKGRARPSIRKAYPAYCRNCDRPTQSHDRAQGLCGACRSYRRRHGIDRPQALLHKRAPHGWCDCGQPAVKSETVRVHGFAITLRICAICA